MGSFWVEKRNCLSPTLLHKTKQHRLILLICFETLSMERQRPKCRLCSRSFATGRALGGHMKAHLAATLSHEDTAGEEEAAIAMCLVMLSRDKWRKPKESPRVKGHSCEVCNKSFRSSQALGGHRVTHRKYRKSSRYPLHEEEKIFECPYCLKVFASGQALGGHKRSHVNGSGDVLVSVPAVSSSNNYRQKKSSRIDLNLPAQPDDDDDRSVVSDEEITIDLP